MSGTWDAMVGEELKQNRLQRGRELARLTKPQLIAMLLDAEDRRVKAVGIMQSALDRSGAPAEPAPSRDDLAGRIGRAIVAVQDGQPEHVVIGMLRGEVKWDGDDLAPAEPAVTADRGEAEAPVRWWRPGHDHRSALRLPGLDPSGWLVPAEVAAARALSTERGKSQ